MRILDEYVAESRSGDHAVVRISPVDEIFESGELRSWIENGKMDVKSFTEILDRYLKFSTRMHHPGYLAHQVAVPDFPAALGDLIHGTIHNPMAIYEMGPSAAVVELAVLDWMLCKIGWEGRGTGVLTHGGSLANLTALLAARGTVAPEVWEEGIQGDLVLLAPPSSHYSIRRAASILGIGASSVLSLDVDSNEVIVPERLLPAIEKVREANKKVMAVVANACATSTGLYDPINELAQVCNEEGIWLHVDAAHGASALVSESLRVLLKGVESADSITWDAHKMLRTSGLCTAVLFKDPKSFDRAFSQKASYLFYEKESGGIDLMPRAIECTKAGLGLKVFLNLAWRGEKGIAQYVEDQYAKTRRFHELIAARDGFECPYEPESNILCFRYRGDDDRQVLIRDRLLEQGKFHISSTEINERRYLRLTVISPASSEETINELLRTIEEVTEGKD